MLLRIKIRLNIKKFKLTYKPTKNNVKYLKYLQKKIKYEFEISLNFFFIIFPLLFAKFMLS